MPRPLVFLTDYGLDGQYVGECHLVIARVAPDVRVIDLAHGVWPQDVLAGAVTLAAGVPYAPPNAVLLAVVDPGVGTQRRAIAVRAGTSWLVGPDNGLLSLAWDALGGAREAWELDPHRLVEWSTSKTFHGRDVFAPAAARLAAGADPGSLGARIEVEVLERLERPRPHIGQGRLRARVLEIDRFGNLRLAAHEADLAASGLAEARVLEVRSGDVALPATRGRTFADAEDGQLVVLVDSAGWIAVARNGGDAASSLGRPRELELGLPGRRVG